MEKISIVMNEIDEKGNSPHTGAYVEIDWDKLPSQSKPFVSEYKEKLPNGRGIITAASVDFYADINRDGKIYTGKSVVYLIEDWWFVHDCLTVVKTVFERLEERDAKIQTLRELNMKVEKGVILRHKKPKRMDAEQVFLKILDYNEDHLHLIELSVDSYSDRIKKRIKIREIEEIDPIAIKLYDFNKNYTIVKPDALESELKILKKYFGEFKK